jgi:hypothetical protein
LIRKARSAFHDKLYSKAGRLKKPAKKTPARVDLAPVAVDAPAATAMAVLAAVIVVDAAAVGIAAEIEDKT